MKCGKNRRLAKRIIIILLAAFAVFLLSQFYGTKANIQVNNEFEVGKLVCHTIRLPPSAANKNAPDEPITTRVELYEKNLLGRLSYAGSNYTWQANENGENGMPFSHYYSDENNDTYILIYYSLSKPQEGYSILLTSPYTDDTITYPLITTENGAYAITPHHENFFWPPQLVAP